MTTALSFGRSLGSGPPPGPDSRSAAQVPVPSYLLALAVGNLDSREISDRQAPAPHVRIPTRTHRGTLRRCRVWSEPGVVDSAHYEFAETETFIRTAESIVGPYLWGRYDLLLLPPAFPYGAVPSFTMC